MNIGKVKITQEQATAIESWLERTGNDKADLLNFHSTNVESLGGWVIGDEYESLNGLDQSDMARALLIGYTVEESYKEGDWVVFEECNNSDFSGRVVRIDKVGITQYHFKDFWFYKTSVVLRHATDEEIKKEKESRVWKSMGRKYREVKIGDKYTDIYGDGFTIRKDVDIKVAVCSTSIDKMSVYYPIESVIEFNSK